MASVLGIVPTRVALGSSMSFRGTRLRSLDAQRMCLQVKSFRGRRALGCRAALAVDREASAEGDWRFDPLGLEQDEAPGFSWNAIQSALMMSKSGSSSRGAAGMFLSYSVSNSFCFCAM